MALKTITVAAGKAVTIRLSFKGIARYNIYLYAPKSDGSGWTRERVVQEDGNSEASQHDAYDIPAIAIDQKRLVYISSIMSSPVGNETVSTTCDVEQGGIRLDALSESAEVKEGAVYVILRAVLEAGA
jgi:hypothetical protein